MENEELIFKKSINNIQRHGKKQKAFKILKSFLLFNKSKKQKPLTYLFNLIEKVSPVLATDSLRAGAKSLDLPKIISIESQYKLGVRWLFKPLKKKKGEVQQNLKNLVSDFDQKKGYAFNKRANLYESMISSRPFLFILKYKQK